MEIDPSAEPLHPHILRQESVLLQPLTHLKTLTPQKAQQLPAASLAYVGDAIYELYVRAYYLIPLRRLRDYHRSVVAQVRAEQQAHHLRSLLSQLTEIEQGVVRRGRNAASGGPKRVDPEVYKQASSFEALIGYLYLTNPERLSQLLSQLTFDPNMGEADSPDV